MVDFNTLLIFKFMIFENNLFFFVQVEAAIFSKIMSGECSASVLKVREFSRVPIQHFIAQTSGLHLGFFNLQKLSCGLSLLAKSRGDKDSWCLMMTKILLSIESHLNDAFQGLEEGSNRRNYPIGCQFSFKLCNLFIFFQIPEAARP